MKITVYRKHTWTETVKYILQWLGDNSGCHQKPERSFRIRGWQFPFCARCTGAMAGQFMAVIFVILRKIPPAPFAVFCLFPMGIDWGIQEAGVKDSSNARRFFTGFLGGFGLFSLYFAGFIRLKNFMKSAGKTFLPHGNRS